MAPDVVVKHTIGKLRHLPETHAHLAMPYSTKVLPDIFMYLWWEGGRDNGLVVQYCILHSAGLLGYIGHCRRPF
jgi:hypothetical protein